jgi:hypothetical protein
MEELTTIGAVVIGLLVRLAIPIVLTMVVVWLLRKLDARWQAEGEQRLRTQMAQVTAQMTPCWDQRDCSTERRAECVAYGRRDMPCWLIMRQRNGELKEACLGCDVFRKAAIPVMA